MSGVDAGAAGGAAGTKRTAKTSSSTTDEEFPGEYLVVWSRYDAKSPDELDLREGDVVEVLDTGGTGSKRFKPNPELEALAGGASAPLDASAARHKLAVRPPRRRAGTRYSPSRSSLDTKWLVRQVGGEGKRGWVPCNVLQSVDEPRPGTGLPGDAAFRRQAVVRELVETENEFVKDMEYVVQEYLIRTETSKTLPKVIRDNLEVVFGGLGEIANFHRTVLMEGVKYYANEPNLLGKAFLRLERDFDKHVNYCVDEPEAQAFLDGCDVARDYFDELSQRLGDDKTLSEHLKLPIQRINDYQLLLKELVRYSECLGEDCSDLKKALELMLNVPHRAQDDKFISSIEGYRGSIHKLGRLLLHDWFSVTFDSIAKDRYLFLFKARLLVTKVRRISDDRSIFQLKDIIRLPQVEIKDHPENPALFELIDKTSKNSLVLTTKRGNGVKDLWLTELREYSDDFVLTSEEVQVVTSTSTSKTDDVKSKVEVCEETFVDERTTVLTTESTTEVLESDSESVVTRSERSREVTSSTCTVFTASSLETSTKPPKEETVCENVLEVVPTKEELREEDIVRIKNQINLDISRQTSQQQQKEVVVQVDTAQVVKEDQVKKTEKEVKKDQEELVKQKKEESIKKDTKVVVETKVASTAEKQVDTKQEKSSVKETVQVVKEQSKQQTQQELPKKDLPVDKPVVDTQKSSVKESVKDPPKQQEESSKKEVEKEKSAVEELPQVERVQQSKQQELAKKDKSVIDIKQQEKSVKEPEKVTKEPTKQQELPKKDLPVDKSVVDTQQQKSSVKEATQVSKETSKQQQESFKKEVEKEKSSVKEPPQVQQLKQQEIPKKDVDKPVVDIKQQQEKSVKESEKVIKELPKQQELSKKDVDKPVVDTKQPEKSSVAETVQKDVPKKVDKPKKQKVQIQEKPLEEATKKNNPVDKPPQSPKEEKLPESNKPARKVELSKKLAEETAQKKREKTNNNGDNLSKKVQVKFADNHNSEQEEDFGARDPDEPPVPIPVPVEKPHHNKIKVLVGETLAGPISLGVKVAIETDEEMSRKYSGLGSGGIGGGSASSDGIATVTAAQSSSVSTTFKLRRDSSITEGKPIFKRTVSGANVEPGERAVFEVEVASTSDTVTWLKDNKPLRHYKRIVTTKSDDGSLYRLEINETEVKDAGLYSAIATSPAGGKSTCSAQLVVHELTEEERAERLVTDKPVFMVQLKDTELLEDTYLRFMVKVKGDPNPTINFFKDDIQIKDGHERYNIVRESSGKGFYELVIPEVTHSDAGKYKCIASNKFGEAVSEATVTVTDFKNIFGDLPEDEPLLQPGEKPVFQWKKDGESFEPEERFKVLLGDDEDSLALLFQHVRPEDAGLYTCVAQTSSGHISCSAELTVHGMLHQLPRDPEKPKLIVEHREAIANVGGSAMLELQVKGFPKPHVKWTHDGKPIEPSGKYKFLYEEDDESMSLVIKNVEPQDAGTYHATAENELGSDSCDMTLNVKAAPKIKTEFKDLTESAGATIRVPVEVEGLPKPTLQFYKDGQAVKTSERIKVVEESSGKYVLVIEKSSVKDSGSYSVVATNEISQVSKFWNLDVVSAPKIIKKLESHKIVELKEETILEVRIEGKPEPEVTWYKDKEEITGKDKHFVIKRDEDTYILKISGNVSTDSASYKVRAKNIHGSVEDECRVDVKVPPKLTKSLKDLTVGETETVELDVKVEAYPKPSFRWYFDEVEISESRKEFTRIETDDGSKLVIKEVTSDLSGKYKCKVVNELGETETSAKLTVNCKPRFIKRLKDTTVDEGATLHLEVEVDATPEPTVKWLRNGREVTTDARIKITRDSKRYETYHLAVDLIKYEEQGEYEVVVTNSMGTVSSRSVVTVQTKSAILESTLKDQSQYESLPIVYVVKATGVPKPTVTWTLDGKPLKADSHYKITEEGDEYKLEISKLAQKDAGVYECKVSNPLGDVKSQAKLTVIPEAELRKPIRTEDIADKTILKNSPAKLSAVITGDPIPDVTWYFDNKEITPEEYEKSKIVLDCDEKDLKDGVKECTFSLTIPKTHQEHTGKYTIKAKNRWGQCDGNAQLTIVFKPEVTGLHDISVIPGEPGVFEARVLANPPAKISWVRDGAPVKTRKGVEIIEDAKNDTYKLVFDNVEIEDDGRYQLVAKNDIGETTADARLKTITEKPHFVTGLSDTVVEDGGDVTLMVRADGIPRPELTWLIDGKPVEETENRIINIRADAQITSTLSIPKYTAEDVGKYKVIAKNAVGEAETSAQIGLLQRPPTFTKLLERSQELGEGEPLRLIAKISGSPKPEVVWLKNGEPVPEDAAEMSVSPDGTVKLYIDKTKPSDSGAYKLVIKNPSGETSSLCAVAVAPKPHRPKFLKCIKDVNVVEGQPLKLSAQVVGHPPPEIRWEKDGLPIRPSSNVHVEQHPDGNVSLVIDCIKPENAGTYNLIAVNRLGESENQAKVTIEKRPIRPEFVTRLQPLSAVEGFPAKLEVKARAHPAPKITWTRNGVEIIPDNQHIKIIDSPDGGSVLLIDACDIMRDRMSYRAVASNEAGEAETSALLTVTPATKEGEAEEEPSFLHTMRDVVADEGQPLVMEVPFVANPIPKVEWFKDDQPVEPSDRVLLTCDGKKVGLSIDNCTPSDAGRYAVKLTNALGTDTTENRATVHKVFAPPRFTQKFTDLQQLPGRDAKLSGKVSGIPTPEISWYKDGKEIDPNDKKYRIKTDGDICTLYINNCEPSDDGLYRAFAVNKEGSDTCEATLSVVDEIKLAVKAEPPSFLKKIGDMDLYKGMTAKFTACATGYPEPTVEWYKDDNKLLPSSRIKMETDQAGLLRLTIAKIDVEDLGRYSCKITNEHGSDICHATLQFDEIDARPRKPISDEYAEYDKHQKSGIPVPLSDPPIISRMTDRHCTLSWKPSVPSYSRPPVTYHLEMCELPHGDWFTARTGIRNCVCTVSNLEPFRDYRFRVRVENKYGISDPSPYATTYRQKLEPDPPRFHTHLPTGATFYPDTSPYFPKDFDIERPPHDNMAQSPRFLRQEYPTQYGVKDQNVNLFWYVYGYPKPKMEYFFNDEPIESGGRFDTSYTRNGQATLFINKMLDRDVGWYEAVATNEHGHARQRVRLEIAELPEFVRRPDIQYGIVRGKIRFEARVLGKPYPEIKWYKDWKPLAESSRTRIKFIEPDLCILTIDDVILKDYGLYSVSARNAAGSISSSAMLYVDENDYDYKLHTYGPISTIRPKKKTFEDFYDLGDELGRGTQGITYHSVERNSGNNYAAKIMRGRGEVRPFMNNELDMLNQLRHRRLISLYDAYDSDDRMILLLELGGGELVKDYLLRREWYTETDIAFYIRQLLEGVQYMHGEGYGHMGLNIGDLLLSHPGSTELKITDFGLTRRITRGSLYPLLYGVPEYASPEAVKEEGTGFGQDMWSIGIITFILLSGRSPFLGADDRETLTRIKAGTWTFDLEWWTHISLEARDFITKLLVYKWEDRLDVNSALRHPWFERLERTRLEDEYRIRTTYLSEYYRLYTEWYDNASCRNWYRRRPLKGAFTHPSRMVYPPYEVYTPPPSPIVPKKHLLPPKTWEDQIPSRSPLNYEIGPIRSESHYQNGPDTYLLQLRDVSFPVRVREYMKVAANRGPGRGLVVSNENGFDWDSPVVRERRRFTDVMDEEIDDEQKTRINKYGVDNVASYSIRRLRRELGPRLDAYAEAEAVIESKQEGRLPFFREKPQTCPLVEGHELDITCFVVGDPKPVVQWFKNDAIVVESARVKIETDSEGRTHFKLSPALGFDTGMYRVVARNKIGQTVAWTRVVYGQVPDAPDSPDATQVSDTEVFLTWKPPKHDGNSPVLCYGLQYKPLDGTEWITRVDNVDHEFYLVRDLQPNTKYVFRLMACNSIGWSEHSVPSAIVRTEKPGAAAKIELSPAMRHLQLITDSGAPVEPEVRLRPDYKLETQPVDWQNKDPIEKYEYISEICRGRYSAVLKAIDRKSNKLVVVKLLDLREETCESVDGEFAALRSLRHERIAGLLEAYRTSSDIATFVLEKLQGADVLTYMASRHEYTEEMVANVISQTLDGLQYLHWRNLCHLDIQPDNIVMCGLRAVQIKLVDFGNAHRVTKLGTKVPIVGHQDYIAPEVLNEELAFPQSDIWSLGVLTYVLLSGVTPFQGEDADEVRMNISFVRYRFEYLYQELSQEGNRFIMTMFKRHPTKRPTAEECHENRWLLPTDSMIKKRERAVFLGSRLKEYCERYHSEKANPGAASSKIVKNLVKSHSIQEELTILP